MALSKEDRIALSKKVVSVPLENAKYDETIAIINSNKTKLIAQDNANKGLQSKVETVLNAYQVELKDIDGTIREVLSEDDMLNSAKRVKGNYLFPNDLSVHTPFLTDGIWKAMVPYSKNKLLGKLYSETNNTTLDNELAFVSDFNTIYTQLQGFAQYIKITGQNCVSVAPTPPPVLPPIDTISPDPDVQLAMSTLVSHINKWIQFMTDYQTLIPADYDSIRLSEGNTAKANALTFKGQLQAWLAVTDFYTSHGYVDCASLATINESNAPFQTRFHSTPFDALKSHIDDRNTYIATTRQPQLISYLGSITQAIDGVVSAKSGLYGDRFGTVDLRLNAMGGSLVKVVNSDLSLATINQGKSFNNSSADIYALAIKATIFQIPAANTGSIHVKDSSEFSIGDNVYVYAEGQDELSGTILEKNGTFIKVSFNIPQKYTPTILARLYKEV